MDNTQDQGAHSAPENDLEQQLDKRLAELERQRAKAADAAIQEGKAAQLAARIERERASAIAAIDAVIAETKTHFSVLPSKLFELLQQNELEPTKDGLAALVRKFPGLAHASTTKRLFAGTEQPEHEEPKPKKRSDFPNSKDQFSLEQKIAFIHLFPDEWEGLPTTAVAVKDAESLTLREFNQLSNSQKFQISKKLELNGDDMASYLKRISRNS